MPPGGSRDPCPFGMRPDRVHVACHIPELLSKFSVKASGNGGCRARADASLRCASDDASKP
eukprot:4801266-Alexandrium_andersonii.AAC.1